METRKCIECGNYFTPKKTATFCGPNCQSKSWRKRNYDKSIEYSRRHHNKHRELRNAYCRKYQINDRNKKRFGGNKPAVLSRDNNQCQNCYSNNFIKLCVHHIDRDKRNNSIDNLITLCKRCHMHIHYKEDNYGIIHKIGTPIIKKWSMLYEKCIMCGNTNHKHQARGHCSSCYWKYLDKKNVKHK